MAITRRPRGNDGHRTRIEGPLIRGSLASAFIEPPPPRKELLDSSHFSGPKLRNKGAPPAKHPDEVVLEVRRLKEQCRMSRVDIVKALAALGIQASKDDVDRYVNYATRAHLVPAEGAEPYVRAATINAPATKELP